MKYVAVKHKLEHKNVWWFCVPDELSNKVEVGSNVLCDTSKGNSFGTVVHVIDGLNEEEARKIMENNFPLKSIIAVRFRMPLREIFVTSEFSKSKPSPIKIIDRINEFYVTGKFNTEVVFSPYGVLIDGYTAYLVSKMFGLDYLDGFIREEVD